MSNVYQDKDFVEVVDADGNSFPEFAEPVPKAWVGTDLLPKGAKVKSSRRGAKPDGDDKSGDTKATGQQSPPAGDKTESKGS